MKHKGLNQLLCAAVVNTRFRDTLLHSPAQAIASGYMEHSFSLTPEEKSLVVNIQARQLEDFAAQVYNWISGKGNENRMSQQVLGSQEPVTTQVYPWVSGNGTQGTGKSHKDKVLESVESFADLYRSPVLVEA
ncbi:hypothetical protein ACFLWA_12380 [Chloroflexota bacterium]